MTPSGSVSWSSVWPNVKPGQHRHAELSEDLVEHLAQR